MGIDCQSIQYSLNASQGNFMTNATAPKKDDTTTVAAMGPDAPKKDEAAKAPATGGDKK
jgi:hypothetical protein